MPATWGGAMLVPEARMCKVVHRRALRVPGAWATILHPRPALRRASGGHPRGPTGGKART
jgi:hypothetical protein